MYSNKRREPRPWLAASLFARCVLAVFALAMMAGPGLALEPSTFRWEAWQDRLAGTLRATPSSLWLDPPPPDSSRCSWSLRTRASIHDIEGEAAFWPEDDGLAAGGHLALAKEPRVALRLSETWRAEGAILWSVADEVTPQLRVQTLTLRREGERHRVALGREPMRWGPGLQGSLLRGRNAPPLWQISWQTRRPLTAPFFKNTTWSGSAFFAYLDDPDRRIPRPLLLGHRLSWQPTDWLELTGTRTILFGGDNRTSRLNLRRIWEILTVQNENIVGRRPPSDSDQRASFEARLQIPLTLGNWNRAEVYYEYGGEDVNDPPLPSAVAHHYGMVTGAWDHTLVVEFAETVTGANRWYRHTLYHNGYFYEGYPLGLALGADAEALALAIWSPPADFSWRMLRREETFGFRSRARELRVTWELGGRMRRGSWVLEATLSRARRIGPGRELQAPAFARDRAEVRFEKSFGQAKR